MSKRRVVSVFVLLTLLIGLCSNCIYAHTAYFIGDFVWHDLNGNGLQDNGEPGIDGVTVTVNNLDWNTKEITTTKNGGAYQLSTFLGEIEVTFSNIPDGFEPTITGQNPSAANDSNGLTFKYDFYDYADNFTFDLGLVKKTYKLGDYVWFDTNRNGIQDTAEKGVAGITVTLYSGDSQIGQPTTTDANGHYYFTDLDEGEYKVVFSNIPAKYEITQANAEIGQINDDDKDSDGQVENGEVVAHTIINGNNNLTLALGLVNVKRYVTVTKNWVGPKRASATVNLLANGTAVDDVELTEAISWAHSFWVDKYDDESNEISYKITEDDINDYSAAISGDMTNGFVITNTNTEKVAVSVKKQWVGKAGDVATINLLADGTKVDTVVLDANNWQHTFADLPKYNGENEITYTVTEDVLSGYTTKITGDMTSGFVVTNTRTGKISIPIEKKWIGPKLDKVIVKLLANSQEQQTVELSDANSWKYTFVDMQAFDTHGAEIVYDLEEVTVDNYDSAITGSATAGFVITNTNNEKIDVSVKKRWIGKIGDLATIKLLADGIEVDSVVLNQDNDWKHRFTNLAKYKDDKAIAYAVEEVAIPGYASEITTTTGSALSFIVTNRNIETVEIHAKKVWVGDAADSATLNIFGDGVLKRSVKLVTDAWQKFVGLFAKYDDAGNEIDYTVEEKAVAGYSASYVKTTGAAQNSTGTAITFEVTNTKVVMPTPKTYKLGDYVWLDGDVDGVQDAEEGAMAGVVVTLKDDKGNVLKTTVTDTAGKYLFEGLENGNYRVVFTVPEGYVETLPNDGNDALDSDGVDVLVTIDGADNMTIDLGIVKNSNKPVETTTEPEQTTTAPKQTTTEPEQTTTAPEQTTTAPKQTTTQPKQTTTAPKQTTTQPKQTTTAPKQTRKRTVTPTKPSQATTKPVETTESVVTTTETVAVTTQSSDIAQETTTTEVVTAPSSPSYSYDRVPNPSDPNSPAVITIIAADGTPLGSYKKHELPNGEIVYISEDGVPLGTTPIVQTGNDFPQYLLIVMALLALAGLFIVRRAYKKQYSN